MSEETVEYNCYTGHPSQIVSDVLRSISAYTRSDRVRSFKIGITYNPEKRFSDVYASTYDKMMAVYSSSSINNVSKLEVDLIEHNSDFADNIVSGGGGNIGEPPYFLYVVIKYKK